MKIASRATPEGFVGHGLSTTDVQYSCHWLNSTMES